MARARGADNRRWSQAFAMAQSRSTVGDGNRTGREIVRATDQSPFANRRFREPVPSAGGKKWVRFAAWDTAGNGAFAQPVKLR